ncbi:MAG: cell surface protein SprA, partial [Bacteroidetes bacterium]|nr:cell surface protein SprA [Bacteroidota bacterium]
RQFKRLKMFVHEEAVGNAEVLNKGDLNVFIRLGTDFTNNYYEYEIPLTPTPQYTSANNLDLIWPASNAFDIALSLFEKIKLERNVLMRTPGSGITLSSPYTISDNENKITIVGVPSLSDVRIIMIGFRNPKKVSNSSSDDGQAKCAEIWLDEMRLTDFKEQGGWAATSTANATLADLGVLTLSGKISTPGFGSIEKKVNERQKETAKQWDVATSLELGKFLPEKSGIKIPMHFDYSQIFSTPQYDPYDPDILLQDALDTYTNKNQQDSIKKISRDYTMRKSLNFVNVKKEKTGTSTKSHVYDVENLDFTYSYTEQYHSNVDVEYDLKKTYKGSVGYNFNNTPKNIIPFNKIKFLSYGPLKLIKDFNFYFLPKTLSFRTDMDRLYSENLLRNKSQAILLIEPTYVKGFTWKRDYGLKFDITQNLKLDFVANTDARIDEPPGAIDKSASDYKEKRDSILTNIKKLGRITQYSQTLNLNYTIPINKISWFNWVTASAKYTGIYNWTAAPLSTEFLGNTIENSNSKQLNGTFNFTNLYNKVGYLKKLNQNKSGSSTSKTSTSVKGKKDVPVKGKDKKSIVKTDADSTETDSIVKIDYFKLISENVFKFLMGVKNVSFNYSQGNGTLLPGFKPSPVYLGQDWKIKAPGTDFIFGGQPKIAQRAGDNLWISQDSMLNTPLLTKFTENFTARATIEPINKFQIEITANRTFSKNQSEYFKFNPDSNKYQSYNHVESGAYSVSFFAWNTSFAKDNSITYSNKNFENFKDYRLIIAVRLANQNPAWNGAYEQDSVSGVYYPSGYGPTSQDVLIPAFLAAYTGKDPQKVSLHAFSEKFSLKDLPMPNWRITYDGLTKIPFIKKYLKTLSLSHAYKSAYTVGAYTTNILFDDSDGDGFTAVRDHLSHNYVAKNAISQISVTEQFSPLINIDMTWNNSLLSNFEIKKSRDLALSFANNQLTEVSSSEYVIGLGYRIKNVIINIQALNTGKAKQLKSDLNIKVDLSIKTNKTVLRKIVENINQISTGQRIISINSSADYLINEKFTIKFFFDKIITNPFVSSQFPNSNTNAGFSLRFTLSQ